MRPERIHQRFLFDQLPGPFDQVDQRLDHAAGDVHGLAGRARSQHASQRVEFELAEFVDGESLLRLHASGLRSFEND